jgi:hypothetical protein
MHRDYKEASRKQKSNRFTTLNVRLEMLNCEDSESDSNDNDDEEEDDETEEI